MGSGRPKITAFSPILLCFANFVNDTKETVRSQEGGLGGQGCSRLQVEMAMDGYDTLTLQ
jgi:hypothetical protein